MLARTALRVLCIEALNPTGTPANGPWPTAAKSRVYDSHLGAIDSLSDTDKVPVVIVYTDETRSVARQTNGSWPAKLDVDLRFELSMPQNVAVEVQGAGGQVTTVDQPEIPVTDPETEAALDLLEAQVIFALRAGPSGALLRKLMPLKLNANGIHSDPFRSAEDRVRFAARTVTFHLTEVQGDCFDPAPATPPTGLDALPEPARKVAKALPDASYGKALLTAAATGTPIAASPTPFTSMGMRFAAVSPPRAEPTPDNLPGFSAAVILPQD